MGQYGRLHGEMMSPLLHPGTRALRSARPGRRKGILSRKGRDRGVASMLPQPTMPAFCTEGEASIISPSLGRMKGRHPGQPSAQLFKRDLISTEMQAAELRSFGGATRSDASATCAAMLVASLVLPEQIRLVPREAAHRPVQTCRQKKARHEALQLNAFDPFSVLGRRLRMDAPGPTSSQDN